MASLVMRTLLLVVPLLLALVACLGPNTQALIEQDLAAARAAATVEERDKHLEEALAKLTAALDQQPQEASEWIIGLVLGLLGIGGGVGVAVQGKKAAAAAALAAFQREAVTDRPTIGPQSGSV
jgi:hypothetical protein